MASNSPWLALLALSEGALPQAETVARQLTERWPDASPIETTSRTDASVTFRCGEATGNYTLVDRPIPWSRLEGPCATAWYWPGAESAMRRHAAHLFFTLLDEARAPIDRAMRLTRLVTATAAASGSSGLVWGPSGAVHNPVDFAVLAGKMARDDLPLHLWIDFRIAQQEEGFHLFTTGMEALGHREFEVVRFQGEPQELGAAVYNIAHYVLEKGPLLKEGESIGLPEGGQANVRFEPSMVNSEQEVIRLDFE